MNSGSHLTRSRFIGTMLLLAVALFLTLVGASLVGSVTVDLARAFGSVEGPNPDAVILFRARMPRVLLGIAVGAGLGATGAALQALLRNSLASPDVIGVSGGASVGAVIAVALGASDGPSGWLVTAAAGFAGSLVAIAVVVRLATYRGRMRPYSLLLIGVVLNTVASATILFVNSLLDFIRAQGVLRWLAGSLTHPSPELSLMVLGYVGFGIAVLATQARSLNALAFGEETASQLGVDVTRVRRFTFVASALVVGGAVSVSGIIGFVGLIVPHVLRIAVGPDLRLLLPASAFGGAIFLVWADAGARFLLAPTEIPVGVLTALSGGPFFIWLLRRSERRDGAG